MQEKVEIKPKYSIGDIVYFFFTAECDSRHSKGRVKNIHVYHNGVVLYDIEDLEHRVGESQPKVLESFIYATELELYQYIESCLERKINFLTGWLLGVKETIKGLKKDRKE